MSSMCCFLQLLLLVACVFSVPFKAFEKSQISHRFHSPSTNLPGLLWDGFCCFFSFLEGTSFADFRESFFFPQGNGQISHLGYLGKSSSKQTSQGDMLVSWWFFPTHLKNMRKSNWNISPSRGEHEKYLKPPPSISTWDDQRKCCTTQDLGNMMTSVHDAAVYQSSKDHFWAYISVHLDFLYLLGLPGCGLFLQD